MYMYMYMKNHDAERFTTFWLNTELCIMHAGCKQNVFTSLDQHKLPTRLKFKIDHCFAFSYLRQML